METNPKDVKLLPLHQGTNAPCIHAVLTYHATCGATALDFNEGDLALHRHPKQLGTQEPRNRQSPAASLTDSLN
jgi:hypothetical protein